MEEVTRCQTDVEFNASVTVAQDKNCLKEQRRLQHCLGLQRAWRRWPTVAMF